MAEHFAWKRPLDAVAYPNIWLKFSAKPKNSDKLVNYQVQDLPEDRVEDAIAFMKEIFIAGEPLAQSINGVANQAFVDDHDRLWRLPMAQRMTLAVFAENSERILALNVNYVATKDDTFHQELDAKSQSRDFANINELMNICYVDPFEKYDVDSYMASVGLTVDPKCRGLGFGKRLLESRKYLAAPFGIKLTQTVFLSDYSNRIADAVGFKTEKEFTIDELNRLHPGFDYKNVNTEKIATKTWIF